MWQHVCELPWKGCNFVTIGDVCFLIDLQGRRREKTKPRGLGGSTLLVSDASEKLVR